MALKLAAAMVATVAVGHVGAIVVPGRKNAGFLATGNPACGTGCASCDSAATCNSCDEGYSLQPSGACVTCQYKFGKTCSSCNRAGCNDCGDFYARISDGTCQECSVRFPPDAEGRACAKCKRETCTSYDKAPHCYDADANGECIPGNCHDGFVNTATERKCKACDVNCKTCSSPAKDQCTSCYGGSTHVASFLVEGQCKACDGDCKTCTGPAKDQCTSCYNDVAPFLVDSQCKAQQPGGHPGNQCTCPNGTGETGISCKTDGQHQCDMCNDGFHRSDWKTSGGRYEDSTCEAN